MFSTLSDGLRSRRLSALFYNQPDKPQTRTMAPKILRLPVETYRPILLQLAATSSRAELANAALVSKAMCHEAQRILYHTLTLAPDVPQPTEISDTVARMVRGVSIRLGNRYRAAKHTQWCMDLLPRLIFLEKIDIAGRGWEVSVFESCLPRVWDRYEGVTGVKTFHFDGTIDLPLIRFLAAQPSLAELELASGMMVPFHSSEVVEVVSTPYFHLTKISIPHEYAKAIIRLAPCLQHLTLTFDVGTTAMDLGDTLKQLPESMQSLIFNTTRRDLLPAHAFLPRSLRMLSTVFVQHESAQMLQYLSHLKFLEHIILNVCQPSVPTFINPFAIGALPPSPTPTQGFDDRAVDVFITQLKVICPNVKTVQVDDQVFNRRSSLWAEERDGSMSRRESYDISRHRDGSAARMWSRMSL